jgi:RNA polymerase-binding transcription factor DksA
MTEEPEPVAPAVDVSTQQALDIERDVETALDGRSQDTVDAIHVALARLDDGTYGTCDDCGSEMPFARLMALPHARRCLDCQAEHERQR